MTDFINNYVKSFPITWQFKIGDSIDNAVKNFSKNNRDTLVSIRSFIVSIITSINWILNTIPWFIIIIVVIIISWKITKKWYVGFIYAAMLIFIGCAGLWYNMTETLSIVITAVGISLLLGFPLGILVAMNKKLAKIIYPILALMQTMPTFVYLVPVVMLFQVGITPALFATTIYSIVPMIKMTSHGILYVDKEMIEASQAFGSTKMQSLIKVQIPQALPTIMTGVNQTIMMAMSMVVTCALIGAEGLGMQILLATNRVEMGKALLPGIAIVFVAIILDKITQAIVPKSEVLV